MALNRDRVLKAAIRIADKEGIEALSMRRLARSLGVEAMSLYNHVANKGDLVDAIVDVVVSEIGFPPESDRWDAAIRAYAISTHAELVRHPWAGALVIRPSQSGRPRESRIRHIEWILRRLREGGFPPELTYHAYHVIDAHILGFTLWELGHYEAADSLGTPRELEAFVAAFLERLRAEGNVYMAEHVEQHLAADDEEGTAFAIGLDLLLDGLARMRRSATRQASGPGRARP